MKTPPKYDQGSEILYDSTVDKTVNPTLFVTYRDNQSCPEYLITFHLNAKAV